MTQHANESEPLEPGLGTRADSDSNAISPLPGEPGIPNLAAKTSTSLSSKGLAAVALLIGSLAVVASFTIQRFSANGKKADAESKLMRDKPTAATSELRRIEMPLAFAASAASAGAPRIPALMPSADDMAEPIGVRRSGAGASMPNGSKAPRPEDAPVLLVTTRPGALAASGQLSRRADASAASNENLSSEDASEANDPLTATSRNLQGYQQQLQGLLDTLTKSFTQATSPASGQQPGGALAGVPPMAGTVPSALPAAAPGLFGGQLQGSATPKVAATLLGNRSLTLPKGMSFTCALKTKVISATSGLVGCQVQRNVFGDDGRVLLIERGSHLDGEYRIASLRAGTVRIPVLWTRIRTPLGVTVDIDSPGTGQLGESGVDGYVDNRWGERIGAAMLLSLIDDSVKLIIQNQPVDAGAGTVVLPTTTSNTGKLAEKVLESTINIPPLIYQNQGGTVGIYVARDVDFSSVYELRPVQR